MQSWGETMRATLHNEEGSVTAALLLYDQRRLAETTG